MTAATETVIPVPALLEHQAPIRKHPARFKVLRKGRRWGKDRFALNVSWFGHGPNFEWRGIVDGLDVAWLAPDYPQARIIWDEELVPRFANYRNQGVEMHEKPFYEIHIEGVGSLHLRSSENVDSLRGLGKRLVGVIVNEAAHLDLAYAWRRCIRPALMDNKGWAVIMSTPFSGTDGGRDEQGNPRIPSYFNTLCESIRAGQLDEDWAEFEGTAAENPKIDPKEFQALVHSYPDGSVEQNEEVYAKLLPPGAGLAFPEWRDDKHVLDRFDVPAHWQYGAGFDWGYFDPSVLTIFATGEEHNTVLMHEKQWRQKTGYEMGQDIAKMVAQLKITLPLIAADSSIWGVQSKKGFPNQAEEIQNGIFDTWRELGLKGMAPVLSAVPKGNDSRVARASLLHSYLKVPENGTPRLRVLRSCGLWLSTVPKLPVDAKNPEDVDTTADDHCYDSGTYFLFSRPPIVDRPRRVEGLDDDTHPGINWERAQRKLKAFSPDPVEPRRWRPDASRFQVMGDGEV